MAYADGKDWRRVPLPSPERMDLFGKTEGKGARPTEEALQQLKELFA
jgi:hypothetical protein